MESYRTDPIAPPKADPMRASRTSIAVLATGLAVAGCSSGEDGAAATGGQDAAGGVVAAPGAAPPATAAEGVTVTGQGQVRGQPEVLVASIGVEVTDGSVQAAMDTANQRADEVVTALTDAGVDRQDIQTQQLSLRQDRPHRPPEPGAPPPPEDRPLVATNMIEVRIRDVDRAGQVLQSAADAGGDATRIHGVHFDVESDQAILDEARQRAFADARDKAEQYAELAGRDLGELISLREQRSPAPPPPAPVAEDAAAGGIPIAPGTQQLTVHVTAVWSLD